MMSAAHGGGDDDDDEDAIQKAMTEAKEIELKASSSTPSSSGAGAEPATISTATAAHSSTLDNFAAWVTPFVDFGLFFFTMANAGVVLGPENAGGMMW